MGVTIRQKDGKWYVFINHKRVRKAKCVGDSRKVAEEFKRKAEVALAAGDLILAPPAVPTLTVAQYATQWLATHALLNCKESTYARYEGVVRNHLLPAFGATPLSTLTRPMLKQFLVQKRRALSTSSVHNILIPLREMLNHAVEEGLLLQNPAARIGRMVFPRREARSAIQPLSRDQLAHLLRTIQDVAPDYAVFFLCLARTGLRLGEALAVHWGDLNVQERCVHVRHNWVRNRLTTPKNHQQRRVDVSQQLLTAFQRLQTQRKVDTLQHGWRELPAWVFCTTQGTPFTPQHMRRVWERCLAKAGLPHVRIHDLRHTYASLLIQQGESLAYVRDQLGHSSIQITVDIYGHLVPGGNRAAVDRLDETTDRNARATARDVQAGE